jgi:hypothetical protein
MSGAIPLLGRGKGLVALVDDEDYDRLAAFKWYLYTTGRHRYAVTFLQQKPRKTAFMHRLLLDSPRGTTVDHIDGDGLNNTRVNLRYCTTTQNRVHHCEVTRNQNGFFGVLKTPKGRYQAIIKIRGHDTYLGTFDSPEDAAKEWDKAAIREHGEFATPNFPREAHSEQ